MVTAIVEQMNSTLPRLIALTSIPLLMCLIYVSANWGVADIYYRSAKSQVTKVRDGKIELAEVDWDKIQINLSDAIKLDPGNPELHEYLALAIESNLKSENNLSETSGLKALAHYKKSISLRPVWPHAWISLAVLKYRLGQIDDEYYDALKNAERLGPWEPVVQRFIVDIGLHGWPNFPKSNRLFTLKMISNAMEHIEKSHSVNVLNIATAHGYLNIVCLLNQNKPRVANYCKKHQKK